MANKKQAPQEEPEESNLTITDGQRRWYWIRTILLTVLIFLFVMWYAYPTRGNVAILWGGGLSLAILGYFVFSYYKLYR
jgi:hypothetical protein